MFNLVTSSPALQRPPQLTVSRTQVALAACVGIPPGVTAVGIVAFHTREPPRCFGLSAERMKTAGFNALPGETFVVARADGPVFVATGAGEPDELDIGCVRDAAAAFADETVAHGRIAFSLQGIERMSVAAAAQAAIEGILLCRYECSFMPRERKRRAVESITLITDAGHEAEALAGAERGRTCAEATMLARDLVSTPPAQLTTARFARIAAELGRENGFDVEIFDKPALQKIGCGGLLGVSHGGIAPPCMIKLVYRPVRGSRGSVGLVGKGVMRHRCDARPEPCNPIHARVKNDMSGAAAVLAAVARLGDLGCATGVTAYLMCTDEVPSAGRRALGSVITMRGGRTVEVTRADADGRLVLCDGLALAAEEGHDAIVDIGTVTSSVVRSLGADMAGLFGNDAMLLRQIRRAARETGESVWQLPLHRPYRKVLDSDIASIRNAEPVDAAHPEGLISAICLAEFVGRVPWAHIDISGTACHETDQLWRRAGGSGFGARLLVEMVSRFNSNEEGEVGTATLRRTSGE